MNRTLIAVICCASLYGMNADKRDHAKVGAIIGLGGYLGTTLIAPKSSPITRFLVGSLLATAAGWAKEVYDRQGHGTYEARDAWMTAVGGTGSSGVTLMINVSF